MADYPSPSSSRSASPASKRKTNTLAITPLPREFFEPTVLDVLRQHFESYGEVVHWVPLSSFHRIIVVYRYPEDTEQAKLTSDPIILEHPHESKPLTLRVYRADPTPIEDPDSDEIVEGRFLCPPGIERNFLISPPGSPPIGWEPIREDPPNPTPLADDLIAALNKLRSTQSHPTRSKGTEVLLEPDEAGVGVYVEICGDDDDDERGVNGDEDWKYGELSPARQNMWKPVATAMPPLPASMPMH